MQYLISKYRNSRLHYVVSYILEFFEMEGFTISYSQCGEDLFLKTFFGKNQRKGFFVDVGCNNPIQKNNTFKLYLKGWRGINIDGNPNLIKKFRSIRKKDLSLNEIISSEQKEVVFYQDDRNHELSSMDTSTGEQLKSTNPGVKEVRRISTTLENVLDQHLKGEKIDLLCVDVEGHDLEVLKSNNFQKYRPRIICVEYDGDYNSLQESKLHSFFKINGYAPIAFSAPNVFYKDGLNPTVS
jgi:FkbM family methyltransferase